MNRPQRFSKTFTRHETTCDGKTGLEWQALPFPNRMTHAQAEKACAELRLGGHSDWRLPSLEELESIRDLSRYNPAIDTEAFPDTPSESFWTSTPVAASPSVVAWIVGFLNGSSYFSHRDGRYRVRAVRGPAGQ